MPFEQDQIYQAEQTRVSNFTFNQAVARVFPDMIKRSVPGYEQTVALSGVIAGRYAQKGTCLYDLGCSLGAVALAMAHGVQVEDCRVIGIDSSVDMLDRANHYIALDEHNTPIELVCADICQYPMARASVTSLNFVLQFIAIEKRLPLLEKISQACVPGGALILSEKVCFDSEEQRVQTNLHHDFKRANGYSELEVAQKRSAIENVLIPESEKVHVERLTAAGFSQVIRWYQCFNFISFLAIR